MTTVHHLDDATLISYSAGSLDPALSIVAATHLCACAACRDRLLEADRIGATLVSRKEPASISGEARRAMLERLDQAPADHWPSGHADAAREPADPDALPVPLHPYFGASYRDLRWRTLAPGMHLVRSAQVDGQLMLLRIAPGRKLPMHSHHGNELTLVLKGAYDDALGHFGPGDVADLDSSVEHQPVTAPGEPCICLAATDAPLRFSGRIARMLQPLFGL